MAAESAARHYPHRIPQPIRRGQSCFFDARVVAHGGWEDMLERTPSRSTSVVVEGAAIALVQRWFDRPPSRCTFLSCTDLFSF
jgi:hypothetical protein